MECGIHASGTFNGNPVGTAAALATIRELSKPGVYEYFDQLAEQMAEGFRKLAEKYQIKIYFRHIGSICVLAFGYDEDPEDFRDWLGKADIQLYEKFVERCEQYGVRLTDRRGREYLSLQHTPEDIQRTLEVADVVLGELL